MSEAQDLTGGVGSEELTRLKQAAQEMKDKYRAWVEAQQTFMADTTNKEKADVLSKSQSEYRVANLKVLELLTADSLLALIRLVREQGAALVEAEKLVDAAVEYEVAFHACGQRAGLVGTFAYQPWAELKDRAERNLFAALKPFKEARLSDDQGRDRSAGGADG